MAEIITCSGHNLANCTPDQVLGTLQVGLTVADTPTNADRILMTMVPLRGEYHEIVVLGNEYCVRTPYREYEALRVPRTLGGVILLLTALPQVIEACGLYIASGGTGHF